MVGGGGNASNPVHGGRKKAPAPSGCRGRKGGGGSAAGCERYRIPVRARTPASRPRHGAMARRQRQRQSGRGAAPARLRRTDGMRFIGRFGRIRVCGSVSETKNPGLLGAGRGGSPSLARSTLSAAVAFARDMAIRTRRPSGDEGRATSTGAEGHPSVHDVLRVMRWAITVIRRIDTPPSACQVPRPLPPRLGAGHHADVLRQARTEASTEGTEETTAGDVKRTAWPRVRCSPGRTPFPACTRTPSRSDTCTAGWDRWWSAPASR
jgi:hypothetical protein